MNSVSASQAPESPHVLRATQVVAGYTPDLPIIHGISLHVEAGEIVTIIGPNGAGKSTLMRTLATLQNPDEGTITYNGVDITEQPDIIRSTLGYLPQDFGVYPRMSAMALLDHIAVLKGITNKAIKASGKIRWKPYFKWSIFGLINQPLSPHFPVVCVNASVSRKPYSATLT